MAMVLVVDDRPVNRELVRTVLGYYGHDTLEAGDGAEALALLRHRQPDLVLADVVMHGMDGYQLARAIRSDPAGRGTPVLFYTPSSFLAAEDRPIAAAHGVRPIASKTGDLAALIEAVQDALLTPEGTDHPNNPSAEAEDESPLQADELTSEGCGSRRMRARMSTSMRASPRCRGWLPESWNSTTC